MALSISFGIHEPMVAKRVVVPLLKWYFAALDIPSISPSAKSELRAPWQWISISPGPTILSDKSIIIFSWDLVISLLIEVILSPSI